MVTGVTATAWFTDHDYYASVGQQRAFGFKHCSFSVTHAVYTVVVVGLLSVGAETPGNKVVISTACLMLSKLLESKFALAKEHVVQPLLAPLVQCRDLLAAVVVKVPSGEPEQILVSHSFFVAFRSDFCFHDKTMHFR